MGRHASRTAAVAAAVALIVTACGATGSPTPVPTETVQSSATTNPTASPPPALTKIGPGEGELDIIVRPGFAEKGANDAAYDWVTKFQKDTGCQVNALEAGTSAQMLTKVEQDQAGAWDGVVASGEISGRLIAEGRVRPLDPHLIPSWKDLWPPLQELRANTVGSVHFGITAAWSPDLLMWRTDRVKQAPTSWSVVYDGASPYKGGLSVYDSPIAIADAALYLGATRPELDITDPYELTSSQFQAALELVKAQRPLVGSYWGTPNDQIGAFTQGSGYLGAAWPDQLHLLQASDPPVPVQATVPVEGVTASVDSWMVLAGARHPNCMLRWIAWATSAAVEQSLAEFAGVAPANTAACSLLHDHPGPLGFAGFCDAYHAIDDAMAAAAYFWTTPLPDCGDGRGSACIDYEIWRQQWNEIKAAG